MSSELVLDSSKDFPSREQEGREEEGNRILGWPKSLFEFFHYIIWQNPKEFLANPILLNDIMCCREEGWGFPFRNLMT